MRPLEIRNSTDVYKEKCYIKTFGTFRVESCSECKLHFGDFSGRDLEEIALILSNYDNSMDSTDRFVYGDSSYLCELDCDQFERYIQEGIKVASKELSKAIEAYTNAIELYQGKYFQEIDALWILPKRNYYHNLYLKGLRNLIDIFEEQEDYDNMLEYCQRAIEGDRYEEYFHLQFMLALKGRGQQRLALKHYQEINQFFHQEMGIEPSNRMQKLYKDLLKCSTDLNRRDIYEELEEEIESEHAFYCEPQIFKSIYELERKRSERSKIKISIAVVELEESIEQDRATELMEHIFQHLLHDLRKGDVFTRWDTNCFLLLLQGVERELLHKITARVLQEELSKGWIKISEIEHIE